MHRSFYAHSHPPGYPFWAIFPALDEAAVRCNVAWRVEVGEATRRAGLRLGAFMVSRGSSMFMEGIEN